MVKTQTTIYLDEDVKRQAKALNLNISEITEHAVNSTLAGAPFKDEEAFLDYLADRKSKLMERQRVLKAQFDDVTKRLTEVAERQEEQQKIVNEMHISQRIANMTKEINELITSYNYNLEIIKIEAAGLIERLNQIRPGYFNEEWLKAQIQRVQDYGW